MVSRRTFRPELKARFVLKESTGARREADARSEHRLKPQVLSR